MAGPELVSGPVAYRERLGQGTGKDPGRTFSRAQDEPSLAGTVGDFEHPSVSILHDLRNPLAAIQGAAELILDAELPPARIRLLAGNICNASRRIQELLKDMLDVSPVDAIGAVEICSLREVAMAACESLSGSAESSGTTLIVEIRPEIELPLERRRMV